MSDLLSEQLHQANGASRPLKREHDSSDDFEHLEHELQLRAEPQQPLLDLSADFLMGESKAPPGGLLQLDNLLDESLPPGPGPQLHPVPATPPPSAELDGPKPASHAFLRAERGSPEPSGFAGPSDDEDEDDDEEDVTEPERSQSQGTPAHLAARPPPPPPPGGHQPERNLLDDDEDFLGDEFAPPQPSSRPLPDLDARDFLAASLPEPQRSPERDFLRDELLVSEATRQLEPPTKPLPPLPADELEPDERGQLPPPPPPPQLLQPHPAQLSGGETDEFESEPEPSPARNPPKPAAAAPTSSNSSSWLGDAAERKVFCHKAPSADLDEIAPKEIFRHIGIDAWFNPERLNPKVAALIYWRDPKNSGIVFGATLGVLLSLAYFSLISVVAYVSLLTLTFTVAFRIYKTVLQAIQKTSDGHPFKDILDLDLTLPAEKVHQVADIAVANANAAASELRRLFLVEDFVDSLKFGILLWSLTYLGAWFNGMTLIIIGVVALFSLPKVYETNKTQIDQNLALVQAKINEITAKVKAALPLSKKADPSKEE